MQKLQEIRNHLASQFVEREEIVEGLLISMIAKQHVLLVGPPGTAKSALVNALVGCINSSRHFQWLLSKFTTPEELCGPISLKALENDSYERVVTGKLPEAHTFFADETFKGGSAILNSLLTAMNERKFYNNGDPIDMPLMTIFGASNEYPQDENLNAMFDRFLLRYEVPYIGEDGNFAKMLRGATPGQAPSISILELEDIQKQATQIALPDDVIDALVTIRRDLKEVGVEASDRRWRQSLSILQAKALLEGRNAVNTEDDLLILTNSLWNEPSQQRTVSGIIRKMCDPLAGRIEEILDEAKDIARPALDTKDTAKGAEANKKLKVLLNELDDILKKGGSTSRQNEATKVREQIADLNKEVLAECLGITL